MGYGPLPSGFHQAQFPYCKHCAVPKPSDAACCGAAIESVRQLLKETSMPSETAAVLLEPILGEGIVQRVQVFFFSLLEPIDVKLSIPVILSPHLRHERNSLDYPPLRQSSVSRFVAPLTPTL